MKYKIFFLPVLLLILILSSSKTSLAEVNISDMPKIKNFIPQPLVDLFDSFNNLKIDFSKVPFINQVIGGLPRSGEEVANGFQWLTHNLTNINNWLMSHIGLNIGLVIKKIGEFFIWALQGIANLIKSGLSFIK